MKVRYIYHSCFVVEYDAYIFIFDYFKGTLPKFDSSKRIFVFSSHKHYDHFNKEIFKMMEPYKDVTYFLSKDIKMNEKYMKKQGIPEDCSDKIHYVGKNETIVIDSSVTLATLTSTDEGVAFYLDIAGTIIYHAGDLNWWSWNGETKEEYEDMTNRFQKEIKKLEGKKIHVAFLPLDPRQEDRFWWGFDYFMKSTDTIYAFPMHLWEKPFVIDKLKSMEISKDYKDRIMNVGKEGEEFLISGKE